MVLYLNVKRPLTLLKITISNMFITPECFSTQLRFKLLSTQFIEIVSAVEQDWYHECLNKNLLRAFLDSKTCVRKDNTAKIAAKKLTKVVETNPMNAWITERKWIQDRCRVITEPNPVIFLCVFCTQSTETRCQFSVESLRLKYQTW